MDSVDLILLNFEEVRRRSIKVWTSIPEAYLDWKPDEEAMNCLEMVRHVLEGEHLYHLIIMNRGSVHHVESPFQSQPLVSVAKELEYAESYRSQFLQTVQSFTSTDLDTIQIDRSDVGYMRSLGDMLLRIAYHESVHTGQLLTYLRAAGVPRVKIWD